MRTTFQRLQKPQRYLENAGQNPPELTVADKELLRELGKDAGKVRGGAAR